MSGGRHRFGGTQADRVFSYGIGSAVTRGPSATVMFYDSLTDGRRYTDLTTISGGLISSVVTDANGELGEFYGPSGIWKMAADVNAGAGPRRWINANDVGDSVPAWFNVQAPSSARRVTAPPTTPLRSRRPSPPPKRPGAAWSTCPEPTITSHRR